MQEIPAWLEQHGSDSSGVGGFTGSSQYGAKDTRRDKVSFYINTPWHIAELVK